jgi:hypothetical protein
MKFHAPSKVASLVLLSLCIGCNPCKEEVWGTSVSPDRKWVAVTTMRDCGAMTSEVVSINVHSAQVNRIEQQGNALVLKHGINPGVSWKDNQTLSLDCRECGANQIIAKVDNVGPIHIEYQLPK